MEKIVRYKKIDDRIYMKRVNWVTSLYQLLDKRRACFQIQWFPNIT